MKQNGIQQIDYLKYTHVDGETAIDSMIYALCLRV